MHYERRSSSQIISPPQPPTIAADSSPTTTPTGTHSARGSLIKASAIVLGSKARKPTWKAPRARRAAGHDSPARSPPKGNMVTNTMTIWPRVKPRFVHPAEVLTK
jgi:hypothetical protein